MTPKVLAQFTPPPTVLFLRPPVEMIIPVESEGIEVAIASEAHVEDVEFIVGETGKIIPVKMRVNGDKNNN